MFDKIQPEYQLTVSQFDIAGIVSLLVSLFGLFIAYKLQRPRIYNVKLVAVYSIPLILSLAYFDVIHFSHTYRLLLIGAFIVLLSMLYYREVSALTTKIGYHKSLLNAAFNDIPDLVQMKDLDNKFTYTNRAMNDKLLLCNSDEAFGRTIIDLAETTRNKGITYDFGENAEDSDNMTLTKGKPCIFLESGLVKGELLTLQVYKSPLKHVQLNGSVSIVGTIGIGRDLTYDTVEHDNIKDALQNGQPELACELFDLHRNRYIVQND